MADVSTVDPSDRLASVSRTCRRVYDEFVAFYRANGHTPSVRELTALCELSSPSTVQAHLGALADLGLIARGATGAARSVRIGGVDTAAGVVRELARADPLFVSGDGEPCCVLCDAKRPVGITAVLHHASCPWLQARKLYCDA